MERFKNVIVTSIVGGLIVLVPFPILYYTFTWLFHVVTGVIEPLTDFLLGYVELPKIAADTVVLAIVLLICFFVGKFVQTQFGKFIHETLERKILKRIPLYAIIKEVFVQVLGGGKLLACPVAVVEPFEKEHVRQVGFITEDHENGWYTVFVPTVPNPTTGLLFFLPKDRVHIVTDANREEAFRIILSCGFGSKGFFKKFLNQTKTSLGSST